MCWSRTKEKIKRGKRGEGMRNFRLDDESGHQEALFSWAGYQLGRMPEFLRELRAGIGNRDHERIEHIKQLRPEAAQEREAENESYKFVEFERRGSKDLYNGKYGIRAVPQGL